MILFVAVKYIVYKEKELIIPLYKTIASFGMQYTSMGAISHEAHYSKSALDVTTEQ